MEPLHGQQETEMIQDDRPVELIELTDIEQPEVKTRHSQQPRATCCSRKCKIAGVVVGALVSIILTTILATQLGMKGMNYSLTG